MLACKVNIVWLSLSIVYVSCCCCWLLLFIGFCLCRSLWVSSVLVSSLPGRAIAENTLARSLEKVKQLENEMYSVQHENKELTTILGDHRAELNATGMDMKALKNKYESGIREAGEQAELLSSVSARNESLVLDLQNMSAATTRLQMDIDQAKKDNAVLTSKNSQLITMAELQQQRSHQYDAELKSLRHELSRGTDIINNLMHQLTDKEHELQKGNEKLAMVAGQHKAQLVEMEHAQEIRVKAMQRQHEERLAVEQGHVAAKEAQMNALEDTISALHGQAVESRDEHKEEYKKLCAKISVELAAWRQKVEEKNNTVVHLEKVNSELLAKLQGRQAASQQQDQQMDELREKLRAGERRKLEDIKKFEAAQDALINKLQTCEEKLRACNAALGGRTVQCEDLQAKLDATLSKLHAVRQEAEMRDLEGKQLTSDRVREDQVLLIKAQEDFLAQVEVCKKLQAEKFDFKLELDSVKHQKSRVDSLLDDSKRMQTGLERECATLQGSIKVLHKQNEVLNKKIEELERQLQVEQGVLTSQVNDLKAQLHESTISLLAEAERRQQTIQHLNAVSAENHSLNMQINSRRRSGDYSAPSSSSSSSSSQPAKPLVSILKKSNYTSMVPTLSPTPSQISLADEDVSIDYDDQASLANRLNQLQRDLEKQRTQRMNSDSSDTSRTNTSSRNSTVGTTARTEEPAARNGLLQPTAPLQLTDFLGSTPSRSNKDSNNTISMVSPSSPPVEDFSSKHFASTDALDSNVAKVMEAALEELGGDETLTAEVGSSSSSSKQHPTSGFLELTLTMKCNNLPALEEDTPHLMAPVVALFVRPRVDEPFSFAYVTEAVQDDCNPVFSKKIVMTHDFSQPAGHQLRFAIYGRVMAEEEASRDESVKTLSR